jgi:hypothetical protein
MRFGHGTWRRQDSALLKVRVALARTVEIPSQSDPPVGQILRNSGVLVT